MLNIYRNIRHINGYSPMEIENIIERGGRSAWVGLMDAVRRDPEVREKVRKIAEHYLHHPYTIRFHFWLHFARHCEAEAQHA